jgi:dolichyl-phosphate beta-glucosyltransferase
LEDRGETQTDFAIALGEGVRLSVVIPAYNEEQRLGDSLVTIRAALLGRDESAEVIVVDDGSSDGTADVAREVLGAPGGPAFSVLRNEPNRGKGYSVRRGLLAARGALALFTDADLSTPIEDLTRLEQAIREGADIAIGSRDTVGSEVLVRQAWYRELAGRTFNFVVRALAVPGIRDTQCGFKLFRRDTIRPVFERVTVERWGFDVELLVIAQRLGYRVAEVPVRWVNDDRSKVNLLRDGVQMLGDIIRARIRHRNL